MLNEEDFLFGKTALNHGIITKEQLEECILILQTQRETGVKKSLDEVIIENHMVSKEQLLQIYRLLGKNRLGNYEIIQKIAQGGTSSIYKASHVETGQVVALKVLLPQLAKKEEFLSRFLREGQTLIKISHPHIINTYEVGKTDQYHFLALELLEGTTLSDYMAKHDRLEESFALEIALQIAKAIKYLHDYNFIHRDVKPQNIMISQEGVTKLIDLGLTRQIQDVSITQEGRILGTPFYISPEQARGDLDIDTRTDVYSWGATLYHLLTGRPPFLGDRPAEVMEKHLYESLMSPDKIIRSLSPETNRLVVQTLAKEREKRPQSFDEIIKRVGKLLRPDLNVDKESIEESSVNQDLLYSRDSRIMMALDVSREKTSSSARLKSLTGKVKEQIIKTRWDLVVLIILMAVVVVGGMIFYHLTTTAPPIDSRQAYLKQAKDFINRWELDKTKACLNDLFTKEGKRVLEEDLEEIFVALKNQFHDLAKRVIKDYQGLEDLKRLKAKKVIYLYEYLQTFRKASLAEKCRSEIEETQKVMEDIENRQAKTYFKTLENLLKVRKYKEAKEWYEKNMAHLFTPSLREKIKKTSSDIQFFLKVHSKILKTLEQSVEKEKGICSFYFRNNEFLEIQILEWEKEKFSYLIKKLIPFETGAKGEPLLKSPLYIYKGAPTISVDEFVQKIHLLSIIDLCHWQKDFNSILRFLLAEKRTYQRDLLIQIYLKLSHTQGKLNFSLRQKAEKIIQSRLDFASKQLFKETVETFWKGQVSQSQKNISLLTQKFSNSLWMKEHNSSIRAFSSYVTVFEKIKERKWKEALPLLKAIENNFSDSLFFKNSREKHHILLLFLEAKTAKIDWEYSKGKELLTELLKRPEISQMVPWLFWESLLDWLICDGLKRGTSDASLKGKVVQFLLRVKGSKEALPQLQKEAEGLKALSDQYIQIPRSSLQDLSDHLALLKKWKKAFEKSLLYPYLKDEIEAMGIFGKARKKRLEGEFKQGKELLERLKKDYSQRDFCRTYEKIIHLALSVNGQIYPLDKDRVRLVYTFAKEGEAEDWETRGWGVLDGKFSFLLANEEDFQQNPLGFHKSKLNLFQKIEEWKFTFSAQRDFGFMANFSQESYLFFDYGQDVYTQKSISIDNFLEKRKRNLLAMLTQEKVFSSFGGGEEISFTFRFYPVFSIEARSGTKSYSKKDLVPLPLNTLYLWLTTGSGVVSSEFVGTLR